MNLSLALVARPVSETWEWLNQRLARLETHIDWYGRGDLCEIAAAYAFHIAESQAFVDGNKRTAAAAAISFLTANGVQFPKDDGSVYRAMIEIANKQLDKVGLANVLRRLSGTTR